MPEATLELVQTRQAELATLIEQLQRQAQASTLTLPAVTLTLLPGEWYAGAVLSKDGSVKHHVIAAAVNTDGLNFAQAQAWANGRNLSSPTREECRLIVAHHHGRLAGISHVWTCEERDSASAWYCYLYNGVFYDVRGAELGAVAVRRVFP